MKFLLAIAAAIGILIPAGFATADPVPFDPTVVVNSTDPTCGVDVICFSSNSVSNPIIVSLVNGLLPAVQFEYANADGSTTGLAPLSELFIALGGALPFEEFGCSSDIFASCSFINTFNTSLSSDVELKFFNGTLDPGAGLTVAVVVPEPSSIVLMLTGFFSLVLIGFLGAKRFTRLSSTSSLS